MVEACTLRVISRTPPSRRTHRRTLVAPSMSTSHWCWLASSYEVHSQWLCRHRRVRAPAPWVDMTQLSTMKRVHPSSSSSTTLKRILSISSLSCSCTAFSVYIHDVVAASIQCLSKSVRDNVPFPLTPITVFTINNKVICFLNCDVINYWNIAICQRRPHHHEFCIYLQMKILIGIRRMTLWNSDLIQL